VLPGAVTVLVALFLVQPKGTSKIGRAFGPIMAVWFLTIAALGIWGILQHPAVLVAINPWYALHYLLTHGYESFLVLGGVFLAVTGAEALYADMGHFGPKPIRAAWSLIVFPSLVLNYAGQAAIALKGGSIDDNIFFRLSPPALRIPLVILATLATIIASQSIITGAFSMTKQAILLGWLPRLQIKHTSAEGSGQIYVGAVNWMLLVATVGLTLLFRKSDNLAAAYGIAVSLTMLMTSALLFIAMREVWKWNLLASALLAGLFLAVDSVFFAANSLKILEGGYVPLLLAALVYSLMYIWHRGSVAVAASLHDALVPVPDFMAELRATHIARVRGTAVFITRAIKEVPPVMVWHVRKNRSLHDRVLALTVVPEAVPRIHENARLRITPLADNFWRATAHYGFMERPDIPELLKQAPSMGCPLHLDDLTYYVGHETIVSREDGKGIFRWEENLYAIMARNAMHVRDFFRLPSDQVVELGRQVSI
jgi:KUP system potassium uptake protein